MVDILYPDEPRWHEVERRLRERRQSLAEGREIIRQMDQERRQGQRRAS